ncbi:hypothetical protein QU487_06335 [Crenobacter sp. SG2305]|uniref:hypothetical protein n=1 Tax=Crenobacter oryzisoli TaxID=3056844 RepID=UPI0025AB0FDB|nr:hypothetical protein [Crenobacter sp. SG2305]MDN0082370.1 hypothetical protein [Crenobacter sp. SG2305]
MPNQNFQNAVIMASDQLYGDSAYALPMTYHDAMLAHTWPSSVNGGASYPLIDWKRAFKSRQFSPRVQAMGIWGADQTLRAAIRLRVTKNMDRVSVTHLSRDIGYDPFAGTAAEMAFNALMISQKAIYAEMGHLPSIGILNPYTDAIPHYEKIANRMNLVAELKSLGRRDQFMYLKS